MICNIYDPTGNITALIEDEADGNISLSFTERAEMACQVMESRPDVEQVGFVRLSGQSGEDAILDMAGGEFCGNASMCAAAWYITKHGWKELGGRTYTVTLKVSGASSPVQVDLSETNDGFDACVHMPRALGIDETDLSYEDIKGTLPVVRIDGISHIIIEKDSPFYALLNDKKAAENAVKKWCRELGREGLGLMFLNCLMAFEDGKVRASLTPLVYIPGSATLFWEHSCASGSCASGVYLAAQKGIPVTAELVQPGGTLVAESNPDIMKTLLRGRVSFMGAIN